MAGEEQPGRRRPAPAPLATVQAFINTTDREEGTDELSRPADLSRWLVEHGLTPRRVRVSAEELRETLALREALRALARANGGVPLRAADRSRLDRIAAAAPTRLRFAPDGAVRREVLGSGVAGAWAQLLEIVGDAVASGAWQRFKVCRDDTCQWAFYDHSRNASSRWCTMEICGSRAKMRSYRARRRASR